MQKKIAALTAAIVIGFAGLSTAFADPSPKGGPKGAPKGGTYWAEYNAGGAASNVGTAHGGLTTTWSLSDKTIYGGADVNMKGVNNVYAGSQFSTKGGSTAFSGGFGPSVAATSESGSVAGGASVAWGH